MDSRILNGFLTKIQRSRLWLSLKLDRVKKHFRPGHVSRRGIAPDKHVRHTGKIRLGYARRSDHDDLADTLALGRGQLRPNPPSVVAAARKPIDRAYRFVLANALDGHPDLCAA